jgi:hypothetical protein
MSKRDRPKEQDQEESQGPNLVLVYSLVALGLLVAIAAAAFIVWPFYRAR